MQALFRARGGPIMAAAAAAADRLVLAQQRRIGAIRVDVIGVEEQVRQQLFWAAFLSAPIMLLLALSIAWRVWVPLRDLAAASRAIAIGQAQVRVPRHYDDEFGAVATAFNTMAGEVERSLDRLQTMNAELVRVDRVKDDFLRTVTHELRTPLTAILGFARMIERDKLIHLDAKHRHAVERILGNSQRMVALVNDLLDSTAIRQGALDLVQDPAEYLPLMQETIAQLQPLAQQKRIALVLEACPIATLVVDATRIAQVLTNLVGNALKYTPEGGRVVVRASEENGWLVTEVQDPGPGIALEDQGRLFMPFTKLDDEHGGSGLGLSICKAIVEAHGGEIGVRSTPGEGATFWFTLPA
jgi:signal transduction histidine kinase